MIYLLRSSPDTQQQSEYLLNNQSLTFSLDAKSLTATVIQGTNQSGFTVGQKLTYPELLNVLVQDGHIVTL